MKTTEQTIKYYLQLDLKILMYPTRTAGSKCLYIVPDVLCSKKGECVAFVILLYSCLPRIGITVDF